MANGGVNVPSGFGGIVRYKEEYRSKFDLKPAHVVAFVVLIVVFRVALQIFLK